MAAFLHLLTWVYLPLASHWRQMGLYSVITSSVALASRSRRINVAFVSHCRQHAKAKQTQRTPKQMQSENL